MFIIIWFVGVFGFQFLLIATNKPTPEDTLVTFNKVWPQIESGEATLIQQQEFSKTLLMVLGKNIALSETDRTVLKESLSLTAANLTLGLTLEPQTVANALNLKDTGFDKLMVELLPHSLIQTESTAHSADLPAIMAKYCIHPRGPLTEFTFLGFPFHYWYTAQFLLALFVLLCLLYALRIEHLYKKYGFVEEHD